MYLVGSIENTALRRAAVSGVIVFSIAKTEQRPLHPTQRFFNRFCFISLLLVVFLRCFSDRQASRQAVRNAQKCCMF